MQVSTPRVATGSASSTTIRRRSKELYSHRKRVSGGDDVAQLSGEVQLTSKEDWKSLMDEVMTTPGTFKVVVTPEDSIAMKADLQIPWKKLRVMKRYVIKKFITTVGFSNESLTTFHLDG